jgi:hypothetical protein
MILVTIRCDGQAALFPECCGNDLDVIDQTDMRLFDGPSVDFKKVFEADSSIHEWTPQKEMQLLPAFDTVKRLWLRFLATLHCFTRCVRCHIKQHRKNT